jgi:hypothetical protein
MIGESRLRVRIIWGRNGDARRSGGNKKALWNKEKGRDREKGATKVYVNEPILDNAGPILIRPYTPFLDRNLGRLSRVRSHSHCEKVF